MDKPPFNPLVLAFWATVFFSHCHWAFPFQSSQRNADFSETGSDIATTTNDGPTTDHPSSGESTPADFLKLPDTNPTNVDIGFPWPDIISSYDQGPLPDLPAICSSPTDVIIADGKCSWNDATGTQCFALLNDKDCDGLADNRDPQADVCNGFLKLNEFDLDDSEISQYDSTSKKIATRYSCGQIWLNSNEFVDIAAPIFTNWYLSETKIDATTLPIDGTHTANFNWGIYFNSNNYIECSVQQNNYILHMSIGGKVGGVDKGGNPSINSPLNGTPIATLHLRLYRESNTLYFSLFLNGSIGIGTLTLPFTSTQLAALTQLPAPLIRYQNKATPIAIEYLRSFRPGP